MHLFRGHRAKVKDYIKTLEKEARKRMKIEHAEEDGVKAMCRGQPYIRKASFPLRHHGRKRLGNWRKEKEARTGMFTGKMCVSGSEGAQKGPQHQLHGKGSAEGI